MPQPQLGYGHQTEASIDQVNQWMRSQPWWQQIKGQSGDISESQKRAILQQAQANGVVVDQGDMEIDKAGNFNPKGHKLRNTLIVAGIAGATIATMGAAGAFSGAAGAGMAGGASGAGAAGAGGAGAAGLGSGTLFAGELGGALSAGGAGAGAAAGSTLGTAATIGGAFAGGPSGVGAGGAAADAAMAGNDAWDAAGNFIGDSTVNNLASGGGWGSYLNTAGKVANALGNIGAGRQADRVNEAQIGIGQNRNIIDLYRAQQDATNSENTYGLNKANAGVNIGNLALDQQKFSLDAPGKRASNSVRGDILANAQDAVGSGISPNIPVPTITGGLRPSMFSANTRALGGEMSSQALKSQQAGDQFAPLPTLPDYKAGPTAPSLTAMPQAGKLDSILNTAATIGSLGGAMGSIPYRRVPQPGDPDYIPPTPRR